MEPFRVHCIEASHNKISRNNLIHGHIYTVIEVEADNWVTFYRLAETGTDRWSITRFVQVDEEFDYWHNRGKAEDEMRRAKLSPKETAQLEGTPFHLVVEGIRSFNTATNLVAALTKKFTKCGFEIQDYHRAESGLEHNIVENPPSVSASRRKYMKLFSEGFLAALP